MQSGADAQLAKSLEQPWSAAVAVYLASRVAPLPMMAGLALTGRAVLPAWDKLAAVPWWAWTGGVLGAAYVVAMQLFAERLGSAAFTAVTVSAELMTAVERDHFGLVGLKEHAFNAWRGLGVALPLAGVGLILRF